MLTVVGWWVAQTLIWKAGKMETHGREGKEFGKSVAGIIYKVGQVPDKLFVSRSWLSLTVFSEIDMLRQDLVCLRMK